MNSSNVLRAVLLGTILMMNEVAWGQCPAITVTPTSLAVGQQGAVYPATPFTAVGGAAPVGFTATGLPAGTSLSLAGQLTGTPSVSGTFRVQVTARDSRSCLGRRIVSWVITPGVAPTITSADTAAFIVGQANTFTVTRTGTPTPTLSISGDTLPSGVAFVAGTGVLSGTPATGTGGTYNLTFTAANSILPDANQSFTLTVNETPVVTAATFSLAENSVNGTSVGTVSVTDVHTPAQTHTWSITAGNTGSAFAIDSSGQLTVATSSALNFETTPSFSLTVQATDNGTPTLSGSATITVNLSNVNEGPTAVSDTITVDEGAIATTLSTPSGATSVRDNDSDPDNLLTDLTVNPTPVSAPSNGILTLSATGTFSYTHDGSETTTDSFVYQICDPEPLCDTATVFITITPLNNNPVIALPGASVVYDAAGTTPILLDTAATVTDADSVNFDTGVLTANVTTACDIADRVSVRNQGTAAGEIGFDGTTVTYNPGTGAVAIGTAVTEFDCLTPTPSLAITLTANANLVATQSLLRNLIYSHTTIPATALTQRVVSVVLTDGDGGTSNTATKAVDLDAAPQVSTIVPANNATAVATNSTITINFSETVTLSASAVTLNCGAAVPFGGLPASNVSSVVLTPSATLPNGVACTVTVVAAQVTDQDTLDPPNTMAADFVSTFTTVDIAPTVLATSTPAAGLIATNQTFTLNFSEAVDVVPANITLTCGAAVTFTTSGTSNVTAITLTPNAALTEGASCTLSVPVNAATDTDTADPPDELGAAFSRNFTVDVAPGVSNTTPSNGATGVAASTNLSITFSEAVNVSGNWF